MNRLIACCGLNCEKCDAYIATINNDDELRRQTAEKWGQMYNAQLSMESINCMGCRGEGVHFAHCHECKIRNCAAGQGLETCGDCSSFDTCKLLEPVKEYSPETIENLKNLN